MIFVVAIFVVVVIVVVVILVVVVVIVIVVFSHSYFFSCRYCNDIFVRADYIFPKPTSLTSG